MSEQKAAELSPRDVTLREQRRTEMAQTSFRTGSQGGALMQPTNGRELMDMANMMAASGQMVRDFYRNNPGDCAALIMICQPYGFNPFMVSWKTYKASKSADAPVSFEGQLVNAMVNMSAPVKGRLRYTYDGEGPTRRCTVTGIDRETGEEITYQSPMFKDIKVKNSPLWAADPDQQLGYFSARAWARRHFPELLLGVYTREEIEEAPARDVTPRPATKMQQMVQQARGEPEQAHADVPDAEEVAGHWTDTYTPTHDGFPSDAFTEGARAYQDGQGKSAVPYLQDEAAADEWLAGWISAQEAGL